MKNKNTAFWEQNLLLVTLFEFWQWNMETYNHIIEILILYAHDSLVSTKNYNNWYQKAIFLNNQF